MSLDNRVAIVTGAAKGIGLAIAKRFAADGARVVVADIDADSGSHAVQEIGAHGAARFVRCDVGDKAEVENLIASAVRAWGSVDVLVSNAGIAQGADFLDVSEADFDRVIRVNLKGTFLVGQAAARQMVKQIRAGGAPGTIINMSSINAVVTIGNLVAYSASKGAINQLTKAMALSLAPHGIRVNAIGPGSIMTDMLASVATDKAARHRLLSRTPLGRVGDPSEIAGVAAFLASDDASYVTGQTIYADGGRLPLNYTVAVKEE